MSIESLPMLEHLRVAFQRHRIQMTNRLAAVEDGRSAMDTVLVGRYADRFLALEEEIQGDISILVKDHQMWSWFERVKGIGPGLAGCLLAHIDIARAETVSALWRYAGYAVFDGKAERRTKGQKLGYNSDLHRICYLISVSFLRNKSPYAEVYYEAKEYYQRSRRQQSIGEGVTFTPPEDKGASIATPDVWTPKRIDMASRRKMMKLFLSHFWEAYRKLEGLPVRPVYALQVLNHDGYRGEEHFLAPEQPAKKRRRKAAEPKG